MKVQIRKGVFETNSSSNHSIVVMDRDKYFKWKNGELYARLKSQSDGENTWGNFWSEMMVLEFTDEKPDNDKIVENIKTQGLKELELYKQRCEEAKSSGIKTEDDDLYEFNEDYYKRMKKFYEELKYDDCLRKIGLMENEFWVTYQEFWDDYITHNDCLSPFEHDDEEHNVYIIGKYYHS